MKKIPKFQIILFLLFGIYYLLFPQRALAHCPLCVAGAGAGLTLSRVLGIDDSITGLWLGGLIGALAFWTHRILVAENKIFVFRLSGLLIYISFWIFTVWSFYRFNLVVKHGDIFGFDKLTFGMIIGSVTFYLLDCLDPSLRDKQGKHFFPYQRLIVSLLSMTLLSIALFIFINYYI